MPLFAGLDVHKEEIEAALINETGAVVLRHRFACERSAIESFAQKHLTKACVALEATTHCWAVAALLEPFCQEVVVSNPLKTRAIAEAKVKTDKVDAEVLAQLLRSNFLPRVWTPDQSTRQLRSRSTERANLTADRTRQKNRIHSLLHQRLIHSPCDDLFSKRGRAWLSSLELEPEGALTLQRYLQQLDFIEADIAAFDQRIAVDSYQNPQVKLLLTLPGVDIIVAQTLLSALGDIERFPNPDKAAAYLGLVPSTYQSGNHCYHGRITKQGASHARWLLVQAAQQVARHPGPLGVFFRRLAKRKNRNVAVVATARKLVTISWHMLKNNEPYRYAQPKTVDAKLSRLRVKATGQKKKTGERKGLKRAASYGSGVRTRAVKSIDTLYEAENLPPLPPLKAGEQAMLAAHGVSAYAESIHQARRVARKSKT